MKHILLLFILLFTALPFSSFSTAKENGSANSAFIMPNTDIVGTWQLDKAYLTGVINNIYEGQKITGKISGKAKGLGNSEQFIFHKDHSLSIRSDGFSFKMKVKTKKYGNKVFKKDFGSPGECTIKRGAWLLKENHLILTPDDKEPIILTIRSLSDEDLVMDFVLPKEIFDNFSGDSQMKLTLVLKR